MSDWPPKEPIPLTQYVADLEAEIERLQALLTEAVAWFDQCRPQWGPGTLPIWYVDAKRFLVPQKTYTASNGEELPNE